MSHFEVYQICCLGYSGSSMLNLLLDALEGFRGLGEIERVFDRDPVRPCALCCPRECTVYDRVRPEHFYLDCAGIYPGVRVLVDSSKRPTFYGPRREAEPGLPYRTVLLYKTPHAYLYSWTGHMPRDSHPDEAWKLWADFYGEQTRRADVIVWYRDLARDPHRELRRITGREPQFRRESWWNTDTHIIGGNTAVMSQRNRHVEQDAKMFETGLQENSGRKNKYRRRRHQIFLDQQWRDGEPFKAMMDRYYRERAAEIERPAAELGLSIEWLREDLWSPVTPATTDTAPDRYTPRPASGEACPCCSRTSQ